MKSTSKLIVIVLLLALTNAAAADKTAEVSAQTHFSAEDLSVKQPVAIPDSVLRILRDEPAIRVALENEGKASGDLPPAWFSASRFRLTNSKNADLVVMAAGPLRGSNVTTFWIFNATTTGYRLVLTATGHDLFIKKTSSKGHRDLELVSMTASQVSTVAFRFDSERYVQHSAKVRPIHP